MLTLNSLCHTPGLTAHLRKIERLQTLAFNQREGKANHTKGQVNHRDGQENYREGKENHDFYFSKILTYKLGA